MKHLSILLILIFSVGAYSQTEKKTIRWNNAESCCKQRIQDNRLITSYEDENIFFQIGVDVETEKKFVAVLITFSNPTDKPFTIYPENFQMKLTAPKNKTYSIVPVEDVAKKIENRGRWRLIAASFLSGMATRNSTAVVTDNSGNRADITITEPDRNAQRNVNNARRAQMSENEQRAAVIRSIALPAHTLFKDDIKGGFVFFKKDDLTPGMIISFTVGDTTYEIPFGTERNPNAGKK